jgi:hypothetical protein
MTNLALWDKFKDPDHTLSDKATKPVPGGAGLTAIDPFTLYAMATAEWGPIGLVYNGYDGDSMSYFAYMPVIPTYPCWGFEEVSTTATETEHTTTVRFWYPHPSGKMAYVLGKGCTELGGRKKDIAKQSLTDACTNAMAKVGFGANVYLGKYNDSKYSDEVRARQTAAKAATDDPAYLAVKSQFAEVAQGLADGKTSGELIDAFKAIHGGPYKALAKGLRTAMAGEVKALSDALAEAQKEGR